MVCIPICVKFHVNKGGLCNPILRADSRAFLTLLSCTGKWEASKKPKYLLTTGSLLHFGCVNPICMWVLVPWFWHPLNSTVFLSLFLCIRIIIHLKVPSALLSCWRTLSSQTGKCGRGKWHVYRYGNSCRSQKCSSLGYGSNLLTQNIDNRKTVALNMTKSAVSIWYLNEHINNNTYLYTFFFQHSCRSRLC